MAATLLISELCPEQRSACAEIFFSARRAAFVWVDREQFRPADFEEATNGETIWIAEVAGHLAGFVSVYVPDDFIHHLFVKPTLQRSGVGSALLSFAVERLGGRAELKCLTQNHAACAFYEKHGFRVVGSGTDVLGDFVRYRKGE